jgi:hypothetical protein
MAGMPRMPDYPGGATPPLPLPPGLVPPEPPPFEGGATPPLPPPPEEPPPVPPLDGVPPPPPLGTGCCGTTVPPLDGEEGVAGVPDEGVPPPEPPTETPPPVEPFAFLFFFLSPGWTGSPPVTGGATGWTVWLEFELLLLPPLHDAIAITTIRKSTAPATAASRRRRYTAGVSRIASTRPQLYT